MFRQKAILLCPSCNIPYQQNGDSMVGPRLTRVGGKTRRPSLPRILPCGHSICECCLARAVDIGCFKCPVCSEEVTQMDEPSFEKVFPLNPYLLGLPVVLEKEMDTADEQIGFATSTGTARAPAPKPENKVNCSECQTAPASCGCNICFLLYCDRCFDTVHVGKAFQNHMKVPTDFVVKVGEMRSRPNLCEFHPGQKTEIHCDECGFLICTVCLIEDHQGHKGQLVSKMNQELVKNLKEEYGNVEEIYKKLLSVKKTASNEKARAGNILREMEGIEQTINDHFACLHGLIERERTRALDELKLPFQRCMRHLDNIASDADLTCSEADIAGLLEKCRTVIDNFYHYEGVLPLDHLLSELRLAKAMPSLQDMTEELGIPEFVTDPMIKAHLNNHWSIKAPEKQGLSRLSETEEQSSVAGDSSSTVSFGSRRSSINGECSGLLQIRSPLSRMDKGSKVIAEVTAVHSPTEFYVRDYTCMEDFNSLRNSLKEAAATISSTAVPEDLLSGDVSPGSSYVLALSKGNEWRRGKVTKLFGNKAHIFYVDYGDKECVPIKRLRPVPEAILKVPFFAIRCTMSSCFPIGGQWSMEAINHMKDTTLNKPFNLVVCSKKADVLFVDLEGFRGSSVQQELVFMGFAVIGKASDFAHSYHSRKHLSQEGSFAKQEYLGIGHPIPARGVYIESPNHFYVSPCSNGEEYFKISRQLAEHLSNDQESFQVFNPVEGMPVAARRKPLEKWYRAVVLEVPEKQMVTVKFVDHGNSMTVHCDNLRLIPQEMLRVPAFAYKCSLSGVQPGIEGWEREACEGFKSILLQAPSFTVIVDGIKYDGTHSAHVYIMNLSRTGLHVNGYLRQASLPYRESSSFRSSPDTLNYVAAELPKFKNFRRGKGARKLTQKKRDRPESSTEDDCGSLGDEPLHLPSVDDFPAQDKFLVTMKTVVSPSEFFVELQNDTNIHFRFSDLAKKSTSDEVALNEAELNEPVSIPSDERWRDALIQAKCGDDLAEVIYLDNGEKTTVQVTKLRLLRGKLQLDPDTSHLRCCLAGLKSPGAAWPSMSTSKFEDLVNVGDDKELFLRVMDGPDEEVRYSVELLLRTVLPTGPFAPSEYQFESVNNALRIAGWAMADGKIDWDTENILKETVKVTPSTRVATAQGGEVARPRRVDVAPRKTGKAPQRIKVASPETVPPKIKEEQVKLAMYLAEETSKVRRDGTVFRDCWLPPTPLPQMDFFGYATYVDIECNFYIQDSQQVAAPLKNLSREIEEAVRKAPFGGNTAWSDGDICVALYRPEELWCRGVVMNVIDHEEPLRALVHFVDYGNEEIIPFSDLRRVPLKSNAPIMCHYCENDVIKSKSHDGKWTTEVIDWIHSYAVPLNCRFQVYRKPKGKYGIRKIWGPNGEDLFDRIVQEGLADFVTPNCAESPNLKKEEDDEDIVVEQCLFTTPNADVPHWGDLVHPDGNGPMFRRLLLPHGCLEVTFEVNHLASMKQCFVRIVKGNLDEVNQAVDLFDEFHHRLQTLAPLQPILRPPHKNRPCVLPFMDDQWYRGLVLGSEQPDKLLVQYVDYGNSIVVSSHLVREIKPEWMEVPAQMIKCVFSQTLTPENFQSLQSHMFQYPVVAHIKEVGGNGDIIATVDFKALSL